MTIDEMIAVLQARKENRTIEWRGKDYPTSSWGECNDPCWDFYHIDYRVKPEPHYRPFENSEEVMEAINKHGNWVKTKSSGRYVSVKLFDCDYVWFGSSDIGKSFTECYEIVVFADGTPFGKLVEE